jgi:hypothetical protein
MFHPLITPLTTYMYSTDVQDGGTVSASDDERLPPGGFSLRHGFPGWFGRGSRAARAQAATQHESRGRESTGQGSGAAATGGDSAVEGSKGVVSSGGSSGDVNGSAAAVTTPPRNKGAVTVTATATGGTTPASAASRGSAALSSSAGTPGYAQTRRGGREVSTYEVLRYIRSTFDDEDVLDSVPLEAAGNPGAWHAWRTHRRQTAGKASSASEGEAAAAASGGSLTPAAPGQSAPVTTRRPEEWNWEGVWEERVRRGIAASLSEGVLYGNAGAADEVVRYSFSLLMSSRRLLRCRLTMIGRSTSSTWTMLRSRERNQICSVRLAHRLSTKASAWQAGSFPGT